MGLGRSKPTVLPFPTGKFGVGCADLMANVSSSSDGGNNIFLRLFYPVEPSNASTREFSNWIPRKEYMDGYSLYWPEPRYRYLFKWAWEWLVERVEVASVWNGPLLSSVEKFPLVLFSHGMAAMRSTYSTFCSEVASHGFIVAAIEHRDRSACWSYYLEEQCEKREKGEVCSVTEKPVEFLPYEMTEEELPIRKQQLAGRLSECKEALSLLDDLNSGNCTSLANTKQHTALSSDGEGNPGGAVIVEDFGFDWSSLRGRVDMERIGMAGHSFGGTAGVEMLSASRRFLCGVFLDAWMLPLEKEKVDLPHLMFLNSGAFQTKNDIQKMRKLMENVTEGAFMFTVKDSVHQSYTDFTYLIGGWIGRLLETCGRIDPLLSKQINHKLTVAFLEQSLLRLDRKEEMRRIVEEYKEWLVEGTDLNMEEEKPQTTSQ